MQTPTQVLKDEHRIIEQVLEAMEARLATLGSGPFPRAFFEQAIDFIVNFADGCHHAKEEERFFPVLERRGIPREGGPIACMLKEHVQGRDYVARMRANLDAAGRGDAAAAAEVARCASGYVSLLRSHITKEDTVLFRLADHILTPADVDQLRQEFDQVDRGDAYITLAGELRDAQLPAANLS
jgi:hemerythrin-like domain-containing protein